MRTQIGLPRQVTSTEAVARVGRRRENGHADRATGAGCELRRVIWFFIFFFGRCHVW